MRLRPVLAALLVVLALPASALAHEGAVTHADTPAEVADGSIVRALSTSRAASTGLPTTWCGNRLTVDDTLDAAQPPTAAVVKVVYAYASDQADRSAAWTNALQGNVSTIGRFLAEQSGGARTVAFDMGTSCGPDYLDVTVVALPRVRASYVGDFDTLVADVHAALTPATGPRDVLIMADQLGTGTYGLGAVYPGADQPGASNPHNSGDLDAAIYSTLGSSPGASGWQPTLMLHEITHNLGAVQPSAPHSTPNGHCWDGSDVMCYADGSTGSQPYTTSVCPTISGAIDEVYDCGHDDYYNPAPAPGSYLDTHWNVFRSAFMAPCTSQGDACAGLTRTLTPPVNTTAPEITGSTESGQALTVAHGAWTNAPTSYAVTWQRQLLTGVWQATTDTGDTRTTLAADAGLRLRAVVTASNADGSATATTAPVGPIMAPAGTSPGSTSSTPSGPAPVVRPESPTATTASAAPRTLLISLRARGRRAGTLRVPVSRDAKAVAVRSAAATLAAGAGRWRLKLCAAAPDAPRRCVLGARVRSSHGKVRVAGVRVTLGATAKAVTVTAALVDQHARAVARGTAVAR